MVINFFKRVKLSDVFILNTFGISPMDSANEIFAHYSIPAFDESKEPVFERGSRIKSNKYVLNSDSLLVSKLNPRINRVWKVAFQPNHPRAVCSTEFMVYQTDRHDVSLDYYYHLFSSEVFQEELLSLQSGTTGSRMRVTPKETLNLTVPFPTLSEQRKIAAILTSVDDAITATQRIIDQTEVVKRGLMQQLLTKGIGHTAFKQTEWDVVKLSDCADIKSGVTKGRKINGQQLVSVPYLRVANVQDGYLDLSEIKYIDVTHEELDRYLLNDGDVLLTEGGDADKLGRGYIWRKEVPNCIHQNHVFRVRTDSAILLPEYFTYLAASPYGKRYFLGCAKQTTNLASINSTQLKDFPIPLPSLKEQQHIASVFAVLDAKMRSEKSSFDGFKMVKQSLMNVLLTGKVRVNVDEPSEVSV